MNYESIYNNLISRAKSRKLEGYKEKHHIIPKSLGGGNNKENLVYLTAREHFIAHLLLAKIQPKGSKERRSMTYAVLLMSSRGKVNSYLYESMRKELGKSVEGERNHFFGRKHSEETKSKIAKGNLGKTRSIEQREHLKNLRTGWKHDKKSIDKMKSIRNKDKEKHKQFKGWWVCEGVKYVSLNEAALGVGCSKPTIKNRVNNPNFKEYLFIPKEDNNG